jgi:hypothetical protein
MMPRVVNETKAKNLLRASAFAGLALAALLGSTCAGADA